MADPAPRPLLGLFAGIAAGVAASAAMAAFQAAAARLVPGDDSNGDPATVQAADRVSEATTGHPVAEPHRAAAGQAVHYLVGAALGGIYGVLAEYRPETRRGFGGAYGLATSLLVDETAVPTAGLGAAPWRASLGSHGYGLASHMVYGVALEGTRTLLAGRR
jgi:putative membrane protein